MVASKCYEAPAPHEVINDAAVNNALMQADAVRMIGIRKKAGEPLVCFLDYIDLFMATSLINTFKISSSHNFSQYPVQYADDPPGQKRHIK